jgi:hypothetical protein
VLYGILRLKQFGAPTALALCAPSDEESLQLSLTKQPAGVPTTDHEQTIFPPPSSRSGTANMQTASKISDAKKEEIEKKKDLAEEHFRKSKEFSDLDDNRRYLARVRDVTNLTGGNKKKDRFCYVLERIEEVYLVQFALTGKQGHVDSQNLEKMCYTGVFETDSGKFKAEFRIEGHTFYCGVYDTKLQAARARDAVLLEVGTPTQRKKLNFLPASL